VRLDTALAERGLCATRSQAQAAIKEGRVTVDGVIVGKSSFTVGPGAAVAIEPGHGYASRGGVKLNHALETFSIPVAGRVCLDVGASTGGFTSCLLERGASLVYAVDTGHGQLAPCLRGDPRVVSLENTDIRNVRGLPVFDLVTVDVSFISLRLILPALHGKFIDAVCLVKPQFEAGRGRVGKGGIVKDPAVRRSCVEAVKACAVSLGFTTRGETESPIAGGDGNAEYFIWLSR
jgi:23S rRNA (cytidine1920-2'-O)/16S rRNA (cytidine1409-2'-O)-methyltransferase